MLLFGCKEAEEPIMEMPEVEASEILFEGTFSSNDHPTSGTVRVESDGQVTNLVLVDFKTDAGPDLRVYLSEDVTDESFIDLGALKATSGDFFYEIQNNTDVESFNRVLIWCEDFSVLFGNAELNKQ